MVERIVEELPEHACTLEVSVIEPGGSGQATADQMLGLTITPARSDAAAIFILLSPGGAPTILTGSGALRNLIEFLRSDAPFEDELGAIVEAIAAGLIEEDVLLSRANRVIRHRTEVTLANGRKIVTTRVRHLWGSRARHERTTHRPYA
jgi:hypothetical protein